MAKSHRIAVIGAGVSGLLAARELQNEGHQVVVFEQSDKLGGLWVYDPQVDSDVLGQDPSRKIVHSSIYHSLRTNLPRALMCFSGFPFTDREYGDPRNFPGHEEVLAYLNDFATGFGIVELIRFNSEVVRVELDGESVDRWVVEWRVKKECRRVKLEKDIFEAVVVCNGHCTLPRVAEVPGIENWPGKQIHSHNYRVPEPFKDQVVVVIGNGTSACDISREISKVAKEVHLSSRSPDAKITQHGHYPNMWPHSVIHMAKEDGTIEFRDGSRVKANIILHCTGYKYEYPFLNTKGVISVDENRVEPLYKHVFPPVFAPWLSFLGLPQKTIIFDMMELQAKWIARVLSGKVALPTKEEMMVDVEEYYQRMINSNKPKHFTHYLDNFEEYLDWLATQASTSQVEGWRKEIARKTLERVNNHEDGYRDELVF